MILNKNVMETDSFLDVNNDIYRMITIFNNCQELKKLLVYTDKKPLERKEDVNKDLRDTQISRVPLLPYDEEEGKEIIEFQPNITTKLALKSDETAAR